MQPADSLFSFVARNGWKTSLPQLLVCGGPPSHQKFRGDPILLFSALDAAAVGPNKNGVVKGRGKRLGKKFWCPESFGTWTKPIMNMVALSKAFCLFNVIFYGFDPMGFITMKTHCFRECVWFTFSNHRTSISKKQNQDISCVECVCHFSNHRTSKSKFPDIVWPYVLPLENPRFLEVFFGLKFTNPTKTADDFPIENDFQAAHSSITSLGVTVEIHHATWVRGTRVVTVVLEEDFFMLGMSKGWKWKDKRKAWTKNHSKILGKPMFLFWRVWF